jgi:Domain of unknown function (DUF4386)
VLDSSPPGGADRPGDRDAFLTAGVEVLGAVLDPAYLNHDNEPMTRATNARIAGFTFLFYIAAGLTSMALSSRASGAGGIAERLIQVAEHATVMRITLLLGPFIAFSALVLGVTLHAITRDEDPELAKLGLLCRAGEGLVGMFPVGTLGLLWIATSSGGSDALDAGAAAAVAAFLVKVDGWQTTIAASLFSVGSTFFCYLLLRGRMIPASLAWAGIVASVLLVVGLPLQLAGILVGRPVLLMWIPMAIFELVLGPWLMIKGVAAFEARRAA